jgi:hypothetical protein
MNKRALEYIFIAARQDADESMSSSGALRGAYSMEARLRI